MLVNLLVQYNIDSHSIFSILSSFLSVCPSVLASFSTLGYDGKPAPVTYVPECREETDEDYLFKRGCNSGINFDRYDSIEVSVSGPDAKKCKIASFDEGWFYYLVKKYNHKTE